MLTAKDIMTKNVTTVRAATTMKNWPGYSWSIKSAVCLL